MQYLFLPLPQSRTPARKPAANWFQGLIGGLFRRRIYQVVPLRFDDLSSQMRRDLGLDCCGKSEAEMTPNPGQAGQSPLDWPIR